jgi:hypothetical protein
VLAVPPPLPPGGIGDGFAEFNPNGTEPLPLTPDKCDQEDIVLATVDAKGFRALFGTPPPDPRLQNIPLRRVPVIVTFDGIRAEIPPMGNPPGGPFPPTKSEPNYQLTLGKWLSARGSVDMQCFPDGTAHVEARFHNLIENGIYSINSLGLTPQGPFAVPACGAPSHFVASSEGRGRFVRDCNFCPMDPTPDGSVTLFWTVFFHSDDDAGGSTVFRALETARFLDRDGSLFESLLTPGDIGHTVFNIPIAAPPLP